MEKIITFLLARLKEPSTWAGIAVFLGMFGVSDEFSNRLATNGAIIAAAIGSLIAVFLPSPATKKPEDQPPEDPR
jgi:hypothetical protein